MRTINGLSKSLLIASLSAILFGCSGIPRASTITSFTISGTVTGLTGTGLVLQDNGGDNLSIAMNGAFTFATSLASGQAYSVSVLTQPANPAQNCTVTNGTGTASANVTSVQVACAAGTSSGTVTIGGTVVSLSGSGLVLQDNGGDNLTITMNGAFTFPTPLATGSAYTVTVLTQPLNPTQICTVANGTGTATANVGNIIVTCSAPVTVGGSVSGLDGTGLVLQDNGGSNLSITMNGAFTFATPVSSGGTYDVTVLTQPSNPSQTCTVTNGSGTATGNVTNVQVICPAVFESIGGQVVGLYVPTGGNADGVLQDNGGDNLAFSGNGPFTFATPIAFGSTYDVSIFVAPQTQPQGSRLYFYQGTATADVTTVDVDFGHNDWTWMDGPNTSNHTGANNPPSTLPPTSIVTSTPGGVRYPATWTDSNGNLWMFGGYGYSSDPTVSISLQPSYFQELWEFSGTGTANYEGSYNNYWSRIELSALVPARWGAVTWTTGTDLCLFGGQDSSTEFLNDLWCYDTSGPSWTEISPGTSQIGIYGTKGSASAGNIPGGRWGATARLDSLGNLWLFGGYGYDSNGTLGLLNDLWEYSGGEWTWVSGSNVVNPDGVYGTKGTASATNVPGGRQASSSWIDNSGNFWLFGGYNLSGSGQPSAFNDLWEFSSNEWTWVAGADSVNQTATYGTQGVAAASNVPGARWNSAAWSDIDVSGNTRLWLFGGQGYDATANGSLGDLWVFTGGQWTWTKGPSSVDQAGIYGLSPTPVTWPYVGNYPGSRWGSGYWIDGSGQLWVFGGQGYDSTGTSGNGLLNDLWRYLPYP
ncbi:MAG: kelch repeat-containing protein [Candidatus Acidiferrales bacterium]